MSVRELLMKPGRFGLKLRDDTPKSILDAISELDHVVITPTRLLPIEGFRAEYAGHVDAPRPPVPSTAVLCLDSRNYDSGTAAIPNTGTAGAAYDMVVNDANIDEAWGEAGSPTVHPTWADWGGEPGDAPMTFICAMSNDPNYDCYGWMNLTSAGGVSSLGMEISTVSTLAIGTVQFYGYIYTGIQNYSADLDKAEWSIYTVEIDPTAGTIKRRVGNTIVAPGGGYVDTFTSGAAYLNTKYGTGNGEGWDLQFMSPGDALIEGKLWRGLGGIALTRTVLSDADRDAWYDYFFSDADPVLTAAIYTGVIENVTNQRQISGLGLAAHLGREDGRGPILETAVANDTGTLTDWVNSLLPPALIPGTITDTGTTLSAILQWTTAREALDYATRSMGAEWRVNPNGSFDAGAPASLFVTDPTVVVAKRSTGVSDGRRGIEVAQAIPTVDVDGYTTRVTVVGKIGPLGEISTGTATQTTDYRDLFGNRVQLGRLVNDPKAVAAGALVSATDALAVTDEARRGVTLSSRSYAVPIHVRPGDYVAVYDPESGLTDPANQINWRGELITPINLRCRGYIWPIEEGMGVYVRASATRPTYTDITPWVVKESEATQWEVGSGLDDPELDPGQLSPAYLGQHAAILDRISAAKASSDTLRKAAVIGYTADQTSGSILAAGIGTSEATTNLVSDGVATIAQHVYQITYRFQLRESATAVDTLTARVRRGVGTGGTVVEGPTRVTKHCGASGRDTITVVSTDAPGTQAAQQWTLTLITDTGSVDVYRPYSITVEDVGECIAAGIGAVEDESNVRSTPMATQAGRRYRITFAMTVLFGGVTYLDARVRRGITTAGSLVMGVTPVSKSAVGADGESTFNLVAFDTPGDQFAQQWVLTLQTATGLLYVFEDSSVTVEDVGPA